MTPKEKPNSVMCGGIVAPARRNVYYKRTLTGWPTDGIRHFRGVSQKKWWRNKKKRKLAGPSWFFFYDFSDIPEKDRPLLLYEITVRIHLMYRVFVAYAEQHICYVHVLHDKHIRS
jgi:hypothetical protein